MNLMLENLRVTDGIYAVLSNRDVREKITNLGKAIGMDVSRLLEKLLIEIKTMR